MYGSGHPSISRSAISLKMLSSAIGIPYRQIIQKGNCSSGSWKQPITLVKSTARPHRYAVAILSFTLGLPPSRRLSLVSPPPLCKLHLFRPLARASITCFSPLPVQASLVSPPRLCKHHLFLPLACASITCFSTSPVQASLVSPPRPCKHHLRSGGSSNDLGGSSDTLDEDWSMHTQSQTHTRACIDTHTHVHTCIDTRIRTHMHTQSNSHTHMHTCTLMHTSVHTQSNVHTQTHRTHLIVHSYGCMVWPQPTKGWLRFNL